MYKITLFIVYTHNGLLIFRAFLLIKSVTMNSLRCNTSRLSREVSFQIHVVFDKDKEI